MTDLRELNAETLQELCAQNAELLSEALQGALETRSRFESGESATWNPDELPGGFNGPGLIAAITVGEHALLLAIPESLPLPDWYRAPSKSQNARLQTLAMELAPSLLPEDAEPGDLNVVGVELLHDALEAAAPDETAQLLMLTPVPADSDADAPATIPLMLAWPFSQPDALAEHNIIAIAEEEPAAAVAGAAAAIAPSPESGGSATELPPARLHQLMKVPVTVSVRLAEKKIELEHLLMLAPGSLITFNKSCDDLLELYVNNCRYALGEAVKIDESFGMKVIEVGVRRQRKPRILEG